MKPIQEMSEFVKETAASLVHAFNNQVKKLVQLVTKQPKKPPLSWESIIGEGFSKQTHKRQAVQTAIAPELPEVNQQLAELPQDIFEELFRRIQKNIVDEVQAIRLYEKLFGCDIQILRGHVHFYKCTSDKDEETIDYTTLISRLTQLFQDHKAIISLRSAVNA